MGKISKAKVKAYVQDPNGCPNCTEATSTDITYGNVDVDDTIATQWAECHKCGFRWDLVYKLKTIYIPG